MKTLLAFSSIFLSISGAAAQEKHWSDYAKPIAELKGQIVKALAIAGDDLFVATASTGAGSRLLVVDRTHYSIKDVTSKLEKGKGDDVTDIIVSDKRLCIGLNGNNPDWCYDSSFNSKEDSKPFLKKRALQDEQLIANAPTKGSLWTFNADDRQAIVGFFKGNIYLYSFDRKAYRLVYKPSDTYNWPAATDLGKTTAFASTIGDGLIVVDRKTGKTARFLDDKREDYIRALANDGADLYIGTVKGLYLAKTTDLRPSN